MKPCSACGETKSLDEYHNRRSSTDGKQSWCKPCLLQRNAERKAAKPEQVKAEQAAWRSRNRDKVNEQSRIRMRGRQYQNRNLKARFGITSEDYDRMWNEQEGRCAICSAMYSADGSRLAVDHDHETGEVRGLLCTACNTAIGSMADDPGRLVAAATYLITRKVTKP